MKLVPNNDFSKDRLIQFFKEQWGSPEMVLASGVYDCTRLDGFTALNEQNEMIGLVTYVIKDQECEIISLDSLEEGKGIGTSLVQEVEELAVQNKCKRIKLITTNDNLLALKFYQKRGYCLSNIYPNAVENARKIKPEIPLVGNEGIPIRDELELEKKLTKLLSR